MSIEGLNLLFKTYSTSESNTVIHVIQMYKNLLEYNNDKIMTEEYLVDMEKNKINIDEVFENIIYVYDSTIVHVIFHILTLIHQEQDLSAQEQMIGGLSLILTKVNRNIREWIKLNMVL